MTNPRVRASYDAVAEEYAKAFGDELDHQPLHRSIIDCFITLVAAGAREGSTRGPEAEPTRASSGEPVRAPGGEPVREPAGELIPGTIHEPSRAPAGEPIRAPLGETIRAPAGEPIRAPLGETIRAPAGEPIPGTIGEPSSSQIGQPIGGQIGEPLDGQIGQQIGQQIGGQIGEPLDGQIGEPLDGQIGEPLDGQIGQQIGGQIGEPLGGQIGQQIGAQICEAIGEPIEGPVGDVGCGPGHVAAYLARRGLSVVGIDLSPQMIEVARRRYPGLDLRVGSMTALDVPDASWSGLVAVYSIIHLPFEDRRRAYAEFARVLRRGAWILVAFHIDSATHQPGDSIHLAEFLGHSVDLDGYFLSPEEVAAGLTEAGFDIRARFERQPEPDIEYPSRRAYLLGIKRNP